MNYRKQNILSNKRYDFEDDKISAVYFLWREGVIVYVGKSKDLRYRISTHKKSDKKFDYFTYIDVEPDKIGEAESYWIYRILPEINIVGMLYQRRYIHRNSLDKLVEKCKCRKDYLELYYFIQFQYKKFGIGLKNEITRLYN